MADVTISQLPTTAPSVSAFIPFSKNNITYKGKPLDLFSAYYPIFQASSNVSSGTARSPWSSTNNGSWQTVTTKTYTGYTGLISVEFQGYISSGTYYWVWRLFNNTTGQACNLQFSPNRANNNAVMFGGYVHAWSVQFPGTFNIVNSQTYSLQVAADTSGSEGIPAPANSQILYASDIYFYDGIKF